MDAPSFPDEAAPFYRERERETRKFTRSLHMRQHRWRGRPRVALGKVLRGRYAGLRLSCQGLVRAEGVVEPLPIVEGSGYGVDFRHVPAESPDSLTAVRAKDTIEAKQNRPALLSRAVEGSARRSPATGRGGSGAAVCRPASGRPQARCQLRPPPEAGGRGEGGGGGVLPPAK